MRGADYPFHPFSLLGLESILIEREREIRINERIERRVIYSSPLPCFRYDLETDKLYSITWYKDHEEFYRYVPKGEPKKHTYHVEGVKVDVSRKRPYLSSRTRDIAGKENVVGSRQPATSNDKASATSREKFHLRAGADKAARREKARSYARRSFYLASSPTSISRPVYRPLCVLRDARDYLCEYASAYTYTYIHTCIYIYRSRRINISRTIFLFSFYFFSFVREILQIIIMSRLLENNCGENHKRRLRRSVRLIRFPVVKSP